MLHKNITTGDVHYLQNWSVVDNTARDALVVVPADVGKVVQVTGTNSYYILTDDSPMTWQLIGSGSGSGTVTSVTSANADATVATTTTTPVITIVQAPALRSATTTVNVSSATAPTSGQVLTATSGTAATWQTPSAGSGITLGTPVASTSGTSIDFTSIPAGTKRIIIMLRDVSTNGTSNYLIQLGDSGGIENTGYSCVCNTLVNASTNSITSYSQGFGWASALASNSFQATFLLTLVDSSTFSWTCSGQATFGSGGMFVVIGGKSLSAGLDRVRITTVNGTDTFDAGTINIQYQS